VSACSACGLLSLWRSVHTTSRRRALAALSLPRPSSRDRKLIVGSATALLRNTTPSRGACERGYMKTYRGSRERGKVWIESAEYEGAICGFPVGASIVFLVRVFRKCDVV
jgi:hypothetical protein